MTLWFDDGMKTHFTIAYPVLKKHHLVDKLEPTAAIITSLVGKIFHPQRLRAAYPMMTIEELKILIDNGWEIASHSHTHPWFARLNLKQTNYELETSKNWIIENLGFTPTKFAVPRHRIREDQLALAQKYYSYIRGDMHGAPNLFHWINSEKGFEKYLRQRGHIK